MTQRSVYPNDLGVGLRKHRLQRALPIHKLSFVSGLSGVSVAPSGSRGISASLNSKTPLWFLYPVCQVARSFRRFPRFGLCDKRKDILLAEWISFSGTGNLTAWRAFQQDCQQLLPLPTTGILPLECKPRAYSTTGTLPPASKASRIPFLPALTVLYSFFSRVPRHPHCDLYPGCSANRLHLHLGNLRRHPERFRGLPQQHDRCERLRPFGNGEG